MEHSGQQHLERLTFDDAVTQILARLRGAGWGFGGSSSCVEMTVGFLGQPDPEIQPISEDTVQTQLNRLPVENQQDPLEGFEIGTDDDGRVYIAYDGLLRRFEQAAELLIVLTQPPRY